MKILQDEFKGKFGPLLIAEIGGNHQGNFNKAIRLTKEAISTGVDYIKFQMYSGEGIVSKNIDEERYNHFNGLSLTVEEYIYLAELCKNNNVGFMASVWNYDMLNIYNNLSNVFKVGSGDLTNYLFIEKIVGFKKPIILSTGLANLDEVVDVINFIYSLDSNYKNKNMLGILQCTSMYPIDFEGANLSVMNSFRDLNNLTVGYSDHTLGSKAIITAICMGAEIIEFHFTDDKNNKDYRDHQISLDKEDVIGLIDEIKTINKLKGTNLKVATIDEIESNHIYTFRRSVYASRALEIDSVLTLQDLKILRPLVGIDARHYKSVVGKRLKRNLNALDPIYWDDIK
jgi:N-acetylneuraminate synthase/N,N'-diacetyllegionaminate synthase